jgi:hypothetical protein
MVWSQTAHSKWFLLIRISIYLHSFLQFLRASAGIKPQNRIWQPFSHPLKITIHNYPTIQCYITTSYEKASLESPTSSKQKKNYTIFYFPVHGICSSSHVFQNSEFIIIHSFCISWLAVWVADAIQQRQRGRKQEMRLALSKVLGLRVTEQISRRVIPDRSLAIKISVCQNWLSILMRFRAKWMQDSVAISAV